MGTIMEDNENLQYYLVLAEGNAFPKWFGRHRKGVMTIPLNQKSNGPNAYNFINQKTQKGTVVGKDEKFIYRLEEVKFTGRAILNGQFFVSIDVSIEIRPEFISKYPAGTEFVFMKRVKLTYEIYCPIVQ